MKWVLIKNNYKIIKWKILRTLFPKYAERKIDEIMKEIDDWEDFDE